MDNLGETNLCQCFLSRDPASSKRYIRLKAELADRINVRLLYMLYGLKLFCDKHLCYRYPQISSIFRTQAEQDKINQEILENNPRAVVQKTSTHSIGNAFDLSLKDQHGKAFDERELSAILSFLNQADYRYSDSANTTPAAYRHVGTADHIHVQVNYRLWGCGHKPL